jgi:hypothetical protein
MSHVCRPDGYTSATSRDKGQMLLVQLGPITTLSLNDLPALTKTSSQQALMVMNSSRHIAAHQWMGHNLPIAMVFFASSAGHPSNTGTCCLGQVGGTAKASTNTSVKNTAVLRANQSVHNTEYHLTHF